MIGAATATMLDAALDYARRGWPVFPCHTSIDGRCSCGEADCHSPGKHPKITDWPNQATTDPATIRQWWARCPGANIGIPTGKASGFFIVDVDPRHGGDDTLRELEAQHGPLPATVESLTGGGGRHIFFRYHGPVKTGAGVLGPGLDVRGDGGLIVAPQSLHASGRRYEWEASSHPEDVAIAEAPAWLLTMLTAKSNGNGCGFTVGDKIKQGERNDTLYREARSMKAKGLSDAAILAAAQAENRAKCEPPLPDAEVEKIVRNAFTQPDRPFTPNGDAEQQGTAGGPKSSATRGHPVLIRLAEVKPEPVTWLWPRRIPAGKVTLLDGDPSLGKSTIAFDLSARVSTGSPMPDNSRSQAEPGGVVILTAEDGAGDTVAPRLLAAGADMRRCVALQGIESQDGKLMAVTIEDTEALTWACREVAAKIVVIDPLMAYLPSKRNSWRDQDVRQALAPLARMAEETGVAVVVIRHLNKSGGSQSIYRGGGSIGIIGAARAGYLVSKDPENESQAVFACVKNNLAPIPPSLTYRIEEVEIGEGITTTRIVWGGVSPHSADALLAVPVSQEEKSATGDAVEFLQTILVKGPLEAKEINRAARAAGIAEVTLRRAKSYAGVTSKRDKFGDGGKWFWSLDAQKVSKVLIQNNEHLRGEMSILGDFEEEDPGLLAARLVDAEEFNPTWGEVDV